MATNPPKGDGHRNGAVKKRSQAQGKDETWTKREADTGQFIDHKGGPDKFKGVRKEK